MSRRSTLWVFMFLVVFVLVDVAQAASTVTLTVDGMT
jgi:hypothetical protein